MKPPSILLAVSIFVLLLFRSGALAQNQHNNWNFGQGLGVNFSSGTPVNFSGSMLTTYGSCASISDEFGNLLFYTNGLDVWDANNNIMPNGTGLMGHLGAQCIIVPKPGVDGVYCIIAADETGELIGDGITYSEVDMNMNAGNGDVTAVKNITLLAPAGEWLTAVPHINCEDIWIICHGIDANSKLYVFRLTSGGIDPVPVISDLGYAQVAGGASGIIKSNPSFDKLVITLPHDDKIDLLDFDRASGVASVNQNLYAGPYSNSPFGVLPFGAEFSRSGNRLYISEIYGSLYQYDLAATNIPATRTEIAALSINGEVGQLQIAPDDKIYLAYSFSGPVVNGHLGVINDPDALGSACNFQENGFSLNGVVTIGLPWYYPAENAVSDQPDLGEDITVCSGQVTLEAFPGTMPGVLEWSNGSSDSILTVSESGTYWVNYQFESCEMTTDTIEVIIDDIEITNPLNDTTGCSALQVSGQVENPDDFQSLTWNISNGDEVVGSIFNYSFEQGGDYYVYLTAETVNNCPLQTDSVLINVLQSPVAQFSSDPSLFLVGETVNLTDESIGNIANWQWIYQDEVISGEPATSITQNEYNDIVVSLIVQDENGCVDTALRIIPLNTENLLYVPNSFTPNADGINDEFVPVDLRGIVHEMYIFNRWGEIVWQSGPETSGWDGTFKGVPVPDGTYTWSIVLNIGGINTEEITGHVNLIR